MGVLMFGMDIDLWHLGDDATATDLAWLTACSASFIPL